MKKIFSYSLSMAATLCLLLLFSLFSCTSDIEMPPPPDGTLSGTSSSSGGDLCAGFVDGTTRQHFGKNKAQFCDSRDSKKYVYVPIGTQVWMAENLNYNATGSACYSKIVNNCTTYGRLYDWATAMAACPSGWHLPSNAEWNDLETAVGTVKHLKAASGWYSNGNGLDTYGFSALPGGYSRSEGNFDDVDNLGIWWSASENDSGIAYSRYMSYNDDEFYWNYDDKLFLFSVRCVQD